MAVEVKNDMEIKMQQLKAVIDKYRDTEGPIMPIMHAAQEIFGYLPLEVQNFIAEELDIPLTDIYGVATFYSHFTLQPQGKYTINVCLGTACYVKGAQKILDKLKEELKINEGETTPDGKFTIDPTRCLGACGLAPVMMINGEVYGRLVPEDVPKILSKYIND